MTKKQRDRRLEAVEEQLSDVAEDDGPEWSVEWREANPAERPEGVSVDAESRTIHFDLWKAQRETLDALRRSDGDITAMLGGYGSGKTRLGARWTLKQALDHPGSHFLVMGTTYAEARTSTFDALLSELPGGPRTNLLTSDYNGPERDSPVVRDFNRSTRKLVLENDTLIELGAADSWSRHAGISVGGIWCDEFSHYSVDQYDLLEMLGGRLRGVAGPKTMLFTLSGNGYNQTHSILERREDKDGNDLPHDIEVIRASTLDNPYLSEGEKESFERQYAGTARESQALTGGYAQSTGLVYSGFSRETHVVDPSEARERLDSSNEWRIYGYDAGWADPRVLLEVGKTDYGQLIVLSEFYRSETHVEDVIRYLEGKPDGVIYSEHEPSDIKKFRRAGWQAVKAEKSLDAGIPAVQERLECDNEDRPGLLISSSCQRTIKEILGYQADHVGTAAAEDHACDSLRYLTVGREKQSAREEQSSDRGIRTFGGTPNNQSSGLTRGRGRRSLF